MSKSRQIQSMLIKNQNVTILLCHLQHIGFLSLVYNLMGTRWLPQLKNHTNSNSRQNAGKQKSEQASRQMPPLSPFFFFFSDIQLFPQTSLLPFMAPMPLQQMSPYISSQWREEPHGHHWLQGNLGIQAFTISTIPFERMSKCFSVVWGQPRGSALVPVPLTVPCILPSFTVTIQPSG